MNNLLKIIGYTILDQMRHKSFYVLLGISIFFVLMIRGCYSGEYVVNGNAVDNVTLAWYASKIIFQGISCGMFFMVAMLSMKIFTRDFEDGSMVLFLSRSVLRWQYVSGRIAGTWILCLAFMFILHLTIFLTVWAKTGGAIPGYLTASLICSINLLFIIICVCLLSLFLPDFISAFSTIGLIFIGFVSEGGYQILSSDMAKAALSNSLNSAPALWRVIYPKVFMVQAYAGSIISKSEFTGMGIVHPVLNLSGYILVLMTLTLICFNKKEI
jgi:ABC-type transport system involved in multi-copper enzyme maturation permease subunit